jgi:glycosyltransferase involved in cell wall biosynthesis
VVIDNFYLVDVLIPCYNEKGYIEKTLKNITNQELYGKNRVHVLVGDYKDELNKDDDYLLEHCKQYRHVTYVPVFQKGIATARNTLAFQALSQILLNFDADSQFVQKDAIERMIKPILDDNIKLTNCECILYDFANRMRVDTKAKPNLYEIAANIGTALEKYVLARGPGLTVAKDAFYEVGGFRPVSVAEDYWMSVDVCMHYSIHAKQFIKDVQILTDNRRSAGFDTIGVNVFDYNANAFRAAAAATTQT